MNQKKSNNEGHFPAAPPPFIVTEVKLTVEKAVALILKILGVETPNKEQKAFVKTEVITAKSRQTFKKLVVFCAGCRGVLEDYYHCRFVFID